MSTSVCYIQTDGGTNIGKTYAHPMVTCDMCKKDHLDTYIDGYTIFGSWANMCPKCHELYGCGLGSSVGQKYQTDWSLDNQARRAMINTTSNKHNP